MITGEKKTSGCVEQSKSGLLSDVSQMAKIPCNDVIDLMKRSKGHVYRVGNVFAMEYAPVNIPLGQNGNLVCDLELFERFDKFEIAGPVRFGDSFQFALDQNRTVSAILEKLVFPPPNR